MTNVVPGVKGFVSRPLVSRFWAKVSIRDVDECWPWCGAIVGGGYGRIRVDGRHYPAHRAAWELFHGEKMPKELHACHTCDNPGCVNPHHIFPGTHSDNMRDASAKGRSYNPQSVKTHCPQGHPYSGDNLVLDAKGRRRCLTCKRAHNNASGKRRRALAREGK